MACRERFPVKQESQVTKIADVKQKGSIADGQKFSVWISVFMIGNTPYFCRFSPQVICSQDGTCVFLRLENQSFGRLCIYSCIDSATILLWATASTTVRAP